MSPNRKDSAYTKESFSFPNADWIRYSRIWDVEDCVVGGPILYSKVTVQKQCYIH